MRSLSPWLLCQLRPAAGTRLPWPFCAAVFSGSWGASCCPLPQLPSAPAEPLSGSSLLVLWLLPLGLRPSVRRDRWRGRRLRLSAAPSLPRGSGECVAAAVFSPFQVFSFISSSHDSVRLSRSAWLPRSRTTSWLLGRPFQPPDRPPPPGFRSVPVGPVHIFPFQAPRRVRSLPSRAVGAASRALFSFPCCQLCSLPPHLPLRISAFTVSTFFSFFPWV